VSIEDLAVTDGSLVIEAAGESGQPLGIQNVNVRLDRLAPTANDGTDVAFALDMALYGTVVRVTGQPLRDPAPGYAVTVRARGADLAAAFRQAAAWRGVAPALDVDQARGDVEATLTLAEGRAAVSGSVRVGPVSGRLRGGGSADVRARSVALVVDHLDVTTATGRVSRLDVEAPVVTLDAAAAARLRDLVDAAAALAHGVVFRRITVREGMLRVAGGDPALPPLRALTLSVQDSERDGGTSFLVSGEAAVGRSGRASVRGALTRDLRLLEARARLEHVDVAAWRQWLAGSAGGDIVGMLTFDGRVRIHGVSGTLQALATGRAEIAPLTLTTAAAGALLRADAVRLDLRAFEWPSGLALVDSLTVSGAALGPGPHAARDGPATVTVIPAASGLAPSLRLVVDAVTDASRLDGAGGLVLPADAIR
jgi:hypothetical protein